MHIEFLLEEPSAEAALRAIVPRIVRPDASLKFIVHQGKPDLLKALPARLRAYRQWIPSQFRIVILIDRDAEDCHHLKRRLQDIAQAAGMATLTSVRDQRDFIVANRIAVEELEAWFFGDIAAMRAAFPRVPATLVRRAGFRDPDAIRGGTWEALQRVLQRAGYYRGGMPKIEVADRIASHMDPDRNTSRSFQVFRDAVRAMAS